LLIPLVVALGVVMVMFVMAQRLTDREPTLVVYTSQDQVYAEPILRGFERETGVRVKALYDSEAVKTVGLANRLIAEKARPRCDAFWNNEVLRTRQLQALGVLEAGEPVALGYRSRRVVINTNLLAAADAPRTLAALTNAAWSGKVALAYPLFGTTSTHFHALRQAWGEARWLAWCRALHANRPLVVDGNSVVVRLVGTGQAWLGLTDSDDIVAGQREGYPVAALDWTEETLLIPNTAAIVEGAPHPLLARRFLDYLQQGAVLEKLVEVGALEGASASTLTATTLQPDWGRLLGELDSGTELLRTVFLR
jgi:iron(III) transport system substrate-binding protein